MRKVKIEELIKLRQGSMSVEEYSCKFILFPTYAPSFVSNLRDDMIRFVIGGSDIMKHDFHTTMLHGDMTLSRLLVYAESIEESKHGSRRRDSKRGRADEQVQPKFNKRSPIQVFLVLLRLTMIEVVVPKWLSILVLLVGIITLRCVYSVLVGALVVVRMIIR